MNQLLPNRLKFMQAARSPVPWQAYGRVSGFNGLVLKASGPDARIGEICEIAIKGEQTRTGKQTGAVEQTGADEQSKISAEVIGFEQGQVLLLPYGKTEGVRIGDRIRATKRPVKISVGQHLLGQVVDAFAVPLANSPQHEADALELDTAQASISANNAPPVNPLERAPIQQRLDTGVSLIDLFLPLGAGQRIGVFAGSGVGKSTLLSMMVKNISSDVNVIALVGERGREVREFVEHALGAEGMKRSVVVVATADEPALARVQAINTAHAIAEFFSAKNCSVLLLVDSMTRYAMAQREIGLAAGEPPTFRGYTPSVFSNLPKLTERCGNFENKGSITAIYSILVEGDDMNDPISDHMRAILDGHIVMDRKIAASGQLPAIDVLRSVSRLTRSLFAEEELALSESARALLARFDESKDLIDMGAYQKGTSVALDQAIAFREHVADWFKQLPNEKRSFAESKTALQKALDACLSNGSLSARNAG